MKTVTWRAGLTVPHDPDAIEDYRWDWSAWLGAATLSAVTVLPPEGITVTEIVAARAATTCDLRVQGGTAGTVYPVTLRVDASDGRRQDRTVIFDCKQR